MVNRTQSSVSVWWDGQCVTVTLPTTTFYLTIQQAIAFGQEVSNKLLVVSQHDKDADEIVVSRDVMTLGEARFLADGLGGLARVLSPSPEPCPHRDTRSRIIDKVNWAKEGF